MQVRNRFDFEYDLVVEPTVSYLICSLPRSGSSLLCEALGNTLHAGMPAEYFHPDMMSLMKRRWNVESFDDYRRELLARKTSPNGVFGLKVHWGQYVRVFEDRDPADLFPNLRFVLIRREDRVRQAVSWVRAVQTGTWSTVWNDPAAARPAVFDRDEIDLRLRRLERDEESWEALFERRGVVPHRVTYEALARAREQTLRGLFEFLGVELPPEFNFDPPALERQADEESEQWVARYLAESA